MKTPVFRFLLGAMAGLCLAAGVAWGSCAGDEEVAGEWIFEPVAESPGWALNSGGDGDMGNLGLTGGAAFSTNVPPVNCDCGHSLLLSGTNSVAGAVSINDYDPLVGEDSFSILAWVRRDSTEGANLSARIFSDADSTSLTNTTSGVEFRFAGNAGTLALRINGTEVSTTVGGIAPTNGEWHHVAVVYDGLRPATNYMTRNVHFYVDGVQRGVGSVLQWEIVESNSVPVVIGNASATRTAANLLAGNIDDVMVFPGWAPVAVGNGNTNEAIQCFMEGIDDIFRPHITVPAAIEAEAGDCLTPVVVSLGTPIVGDDCLVSLVTNNAPEAFPVGTNVVMWTVVDEAGNVSNSFQTVTVVPSRTGDCDEDGLTDFQEVMTYGTDWNCSDTDGDNIDDGTEVGLGTSPLRPDSDGDGWTDGEEILAGTDPLDPMSALGIARGVLLHAIKYSVAEDSQWVQLHCSGPREVDISNFRLQVAGTNWETQLTFPSNTWMIPGHFLLIGGTNVANADIVAELALPESFSGLPTAGVRLMPPDNSTNAPVDVLMYGTHVPFNEQFLDTTGWLSETTNLWASYSRHLERRTLGHDTDREEDWRHIQDEGVANSQIVFDTDADGLSDEEEYRRDLQPLNPDSDSDGLEDGFETRMGLNHALSDSLGDGIVDSARTNPQTGNSYLDDQRSDGLSLEWEASKPGWSWGDSIGSNGWVRFDLTSAAGDGIWAIIRERGHTPENFDYEVQDASVVFSKNTYFNSFRTLRLFLVPTSSNGCHIVVRDGGGSGVTNPPNLGPDISATFKNVSVEITMLDAPRTRDGSPAYNVAAQSSHNDARPTAFRLSATPLYELPGSVSLNWDSSKLAIYDSPAAEQPLSSLSLPLSGFAPRTLYLEGLSAGSTSLRWNYAEDTRVFDLANVNILEIELDDSPVELLRGETLDFPC